MAIKIAKRAVDGMQPEAKDAFLWDGDVKGFGLKVTPTGSKVYILQYRQAGRVRRYTIGKHGSPWTPELARQEAARLLRMIAEGKDPQAAKAEARRPREDDRFSSVADLFITRYAMKHNKAWQEPKRNLLQCVCPVWGDRIITDITRRDVIRLLDDIVDSGRPVLANRVFSTIRKMFNWCIERDIVTSSPCDKVKAPTKEKERDRVLSVDELRAVWLAADSLPYPYGPWVKLLILTAQRRDEVANMTWGEVNLDTGLWIIPSERAKNDKTHYVHLSSLAVNLLRALPRIGEVGFVFTATGRTGVSAFSDTKEDSDAHILTAMQKDAEERGADPKAVKPIPGWRFHDLRRSAATFMAEDGIPPHVVDKLLNHVQGTIKGVAAIYNRHQYLDERRDALHAWARRIDQIVNGTPPNVVTLAERRAGMRE